ncbi:MAG: ABC transporter substrate-binding protein [Candidatus Methanomethylophilaceae archaeon]|nr:ABC transporter substrate-binding protein [Candidatus Methanomethylophilaceae archaeon]
MSIGPKNAIAIAIVAILVVGGAVAYFTLSGGGDDTPEYIENDTTGLKVDFAYNPEIRLAIFGNTDGDDQIDRDDLNLLKSIVEDNTKYDSEENAFADTDGNGYVNGSDVALLTKLVNKEECKLYYWDNTYNINSIDYPLKGKIASHHVYPLDACIILGLYDDVVGMTNQGFQNSIGKDQSRYPGAGTTIKNIGAPEEDPEAMLMSGANILIAPAASRDYTKVVEAYDAANIDLQIVRLCMSQYYTTCADLYGSILMLGVMFQKEAEAEEYVGFVDELLEYVNDSKLNLASYSFITPYDITETAMELDSSLTNGNAMGDVYTISKLPMDSANVITESNYCPQVSMETVLEIDPEVIVIITFHTYAWTVEEHQAEIDELAEYFKGTDAYENGRIYSVNYYNIANYGGIPQLALLASYIWPESFSEEVGWEYLQKYYSTWTEYVDPDVKEMGNAIPYQWEKP